MSITSYNLKTTDEIGDNPSAFGPNLIPGVSIKKQSNKVLDFLQPINVSKVLDTFHLPSSQESKPVQMSVSPIQPTFLNLAEAPAYYASKFLVEPAFNFLSSTIKLATGKQIPKLSIPSFTAGNLIDGSSYQQKYQDQIDAGVPEKDAYKNTLIGGLNDALLLAEPIKEGFGFGIRKISPTKLITPSIESYSKETLSDYLTGRKTAEQLGIPPEVKTKISDTLKTMTTPEKAKFLQGFDLLDAKPSTLGKIFGIDDQEAKNILSDIYNGPARQAPSGFLPGYEQYKPNPEAGFLDVSGEPKRGRPIGFGSNTTIPKDLEPLAVEARKYKSAEELGGRYGIQGTGNRTPRVQWVSTSSKNIPPEQKIYSSTLAEKANIDSVPKPLKISGNTLLELNRAFKNFGYGSNEFNIVVDKAIREAKAENLANIISLDGKNILQGAPPFDFYNKAVGGNSNIIQSTSEEIIPQGIKSLVEEAKKHNNVEDFIKAAHEGKIPSYARSNKIDPQEVNALKSIYKKYVSSNVSSKTKIGIEPTKAEQVNLAAERAKAGEDFGPRNPPKALEPFKESGALDAVDKLIAEGKVRVVSRNNKDVFQVKKGGEWVNARDSESAVRQVTEPAKPPKPKVYTKADQEKIDFNKAMLENARERIADHPAKPLLKFIDKKEGQFEDFKNPDLARNDKEAEKIKAKNDKIVKTAEKAFQDRPELSDKFDNADTIKDVIADYSQQKEIEKSLVATKKALLENLKPIPPKTPESNILKSPEQIDTEGGEGRSLEILAKEALDILNGEPFDINSSLPKIIDNVVTPVKRKVHIIDTYLTTPHFVMEKIGFGKEAKMLRNGMDNYLKELPKNIEKISKWLERLKTDEARLDVFRWLDGKPITLPPGELQIGREIKDWLKEWAIRLKLPEDKILSHYITHLFNREIIEKEFDEELAKIITDKIPKGIYDPFLLERLGKKGYIEDLGLSLDAYVKRATRKVHIDPALEAIQDKAGVSLEFSPLEKSQFNYIKKYIDSVNMRPGELEEGIDNLVKSVIGYRLGQRPVVTTLNFLRQSVFRAFIGLNLSSALRNISQGINTYATLGEKHTALGYLGLFNKGAMQELYREGVLNSDFVQDRVLSSGKKAIQKFDKVLFSFFETAEKINRGSAYFGAKSKYWADHTRKIDSKKVFSGSEEEAIKYAKSIVRKTQFVFDSVDTPVGINNPIAKTFTQLQGYTIKQVEFLAGMAKDKNFIGLLRYALAGIAFVYTIGKAFGMQPKELIPWFRFDTPPSLKFPTEVFNALTNAPDKYGKQRSITKKVSDVGASALSFIPGSSQIKKTYQGIESVKGGGVFNTGGNLEFKQGQSLPEKIQAVLFGKYASNEAQDYFNRSDIKSKQEAPVKDIYNQAQKLMTQGKEDEAQTLINNLSDSDYETYKKIRSTEKRAQTLKEEQDIMPIVIRVQKLKEAGKEDEAQATVDALSDEDYRVYKLAKNKLQ